MRRSAAKLLGAGPAPTGVIVDRFRFEGTYERLRRALLAAPDDGRLDRPLSYWAMPTDRRLPLALIDLSVRHLLTNSLAEIMGTPGVGQKKILGLFELLRRALKSESPDASFGLPGVTKVTRPASVTDRSCSADVISEAVWRMWADTVHRAGLEGHFLGRVAPCLRPLPTVIWSKPLGDYTALSLEEIRDLKTHGEKRVRAVLEVFSAVHEAVSTSVLNEYLEVDLQPRFVPMLTRWLARAQSSADLLSAHALGENVLKPLLSQVTHDLGPEVAQLAEWRVNPLPNALSMKQQAERLGVTRARVYQLLDDCARMAAVRWPEGRWLLAPVETNRLCYESGALELLVNSRALFYP